MSRPRRLACAGLLPGRAHTGGHASVGGRHRPRPSVRSSPGLCGEELRNSLEPPAVGTSSCSSCHAGGNYSAGHPPLPLIAQLPRWELKSVSAASPALWLLVEGLFSEAGPWPRSPSATVFSLGPVLLKSTSVLSLCAAAQGSSSSPGSMPASARCWRGGEQNPHSSNPSSGPALYLEHKVRWPGFQYWLCHLAV